MRSFLVDAEAKFLWSRKTDEIPERKRKSAAKQMTRLRGNGDYPPQIEEQAPVH
jgi:hypothetical protein